MSHYDQAKKPGRQPIRIVELVLDQCALFYGNDPCNAGDRAANHPNLIQQSQVFSGGWSTDATLALSGFTAPNSTLTGVLLHDGDAGNALARVFSADISALAASSWLHGSVHFLKGSQPTRPALQVLANGSGTQIEGLAVVALDTGIYSGNAGAANLKITDCGSWWRVGFRINKGYHTNAQIVVSPAVASGTLAVNTLASIVGSVGAWGAMLVNTGAQQNYLARGVESQWLTTGLAGACYNTFATCPVQSKFLGGNLTLRFVDQDLDVPIGLTAYPAVLGVDYTPGRLTPRQGLGQSVSVSIRLADFVDGDRWTDKYFDQRSYNPSSQGTFFGKLRARDPYIQNRKLIVREGFYDPSTAFTFSNFIDREFRVDELSELSAKGDVSLRATDLLRLTSEDRAVCPVPSTAGLTSGINSGTTTIVLPSSRDAAYYAGFCHVKIDEEIIRLGTQAGSSFTTCVRAQGGTTATDHDSGSTVQVCATFSYTNIIDIIRDLVQNYAAISSVYIPYSSWNAEKSQSLSDVNLYNIVAEPTPVRELLDQLVEIGDLAMWYDEVDKFIYLKNQLPWVSTQATLTDTANFVSGTFKVDERDDLRVTRVTIDYGATNYIRPDKFKNSITVFNTDREATFQYGRQSPFVLKTQWITASQSVLANRLANAILARYQTMPLEVGFQLDARDISSVRVGDVVYASSRLLQDTDGSNLEARFQLTEMTPRDRGSLYSYKGISYLGIPQASAATTLTIDVSTHNYNVNSALGGLSTPATIQVTVYPGVTLGGSGSGVSSYAGLVFGTLPVGCTLTLINCGEILGYAGALGLGGEGDVNYNEITGEWDFSLIQAPLGGSPGGTAIVVASGTTTYIQNNAGYIFAGGPGGGGGGINWNGGPIVTNGGFGGLGQGYTNSGGPTAPETAGVLNGGTAGAWGATANAGEDGTYADGGEAGAQGYAVKLLGTASITWLNGYYATHVKGQVGI